MDQIKQSLNQKCSNQPIDNLYWINIPKKLYLPLQREHELSCGPYYFAIETGQHWLKAELLVRSSQKIRCECICYADKAQREYILNWMDQLLSQLNVSI